MHTSYGNVRNPFLRNGINVTTRHSKVVRSWVQESFFRYAPVPTLVKLWYDWNYGTAAARREGFPQPTMSLPLILWLAPFGLSPAALNEVLGAVKSTVLSAEL